MQKTLFSSRKALCVYGDLRETGIFQDSGPMRPYIGKYPYMHRQDLFAFFAQFVYIDLRSANMEARMKVRIGPRDKIVPFPIALVVSGSFESPNIATVGKVGIVASDPPVIGISFRKDRYSLSLIRETKQFSVNTPSAKHCIETDYCGLVSGRESDKIKDIKMTPIRGSEIDTPILKECPYNLECKLLREIVLGDWVLLLADICEVHIDEDKLLDSHTGAIDVTKVNPMVFCGSVNEYRVLGKTVGKGFHDGQTLCSGK